MPPDANPFLGRRRIRLSLDHRELMHDQLVAVCRTARRYPTSVMFPMVSTLDELLEARQVLADAAGPLGLPTGLRVGIMVEVPAAALKIESFLPHVDFGQHRDQRPDAVHLGGPRPIPRWVNWVAFPRRTRAHHPAVAFCEGRSPTPGDLSCASARSPARHRCRPRRRPRRGRAGTDSGRPRDQVQQMGEEATCQLLREHRAEYAIGRRRPAVHLQGRHRDLRNNYRTKVWAPAVIRAGLQRGVTYHNLPAAHASWLLAGGADMVVVQDSLGPPPDHHHLLGARLRGSPGEVRKLNR